MPISSGSCVNCVDILEAGPVIKGPPGIVYGPGPVSVTSLDNVVYVQKGPDINIVVAEIGGHFLASTVGIPTPSFAYCNNGGAIHFLSEKVSSTVRDISPWLRRNRQGLMKQICEIIVFDIWVMNYDRNIGNLLPFPASGDSSTSLVAIDFEKSAALRGPHPLVEAHVVATPKSLWPTGELGNMARNTAIPKNFISRIKSTPDEAIRKDITDIVAILGSAFSWADSSIKLLLKRRDNISTLVVEVWR